MGFIENAGEVFASKSKLADYHDSMNADFFEDWFENKILRALEEPSIIILDNASHHSRRNEKCPVSSSTKGEIMEWLKEKGISFEPTALKADLLILAKAHCPADQTYFIDELAHKYGHEILRLPPYHCHYNPIELVWGVTKTYFDHRIGSTTGTDESVFEVWRQALAKVPDHEWPKYVNHTEKLIQDSYTREHVIDEVRPLIFTVNNEDEETDISSDSSDGEVEEEED